MTVGRTPAEPRCVRRKKSCTPLDPGGTSRADERLRSRSRSPRQITSQPSTTTAAQPSGLDFELRLPDQGLTNPNGDHRNRAREDRSRTTPGRHGRTRRPRTGMSVCTPAQYHAESATSTPGQGCPESSKLGTLIAKTPLLEEPDRRIGVSRGAAREPLRLAARALYRREGTRTWCVDQAGRGGARRPGHGSAHGDVRQSAAVAVLLLPAGSARRPPRAADHTTGVRDLHHHRRGSTRSRTRASRPNGPRRSRSARARTVVRASSSEAQLPNSPSLQAGTVSTGRGCVLPVRVQDLLVKTAPSIWVRSTRPCPRDCWASSPACPYCSDAQIAAATARSDEGEGATGAILPVVS